VRLGAVSRPALSSLALQQPVPAPLPPLSTAGGENTLLFLQHVAHDEHAAAEPEPNTPELVDVPTEVLHGPAIFTNVHAREQAQARQDAVDEAVGQRHDRLAALAAAEQPVVEDTEYQFHPPHANQGRKFLWRDTEMLVLAAALNSCRFDATSGKNIRWNKLVCKARCAPPPTLSPPRPPGSSARALV